jgi:hypothetical protein
MQEKLQQFEFIKERVMYFIESQRFKKTDFFNKIEATSANFRGNQINSSLSSTTIERIITHFPQLNLYWLILGTGEMLVKTENIESKESSIDKIKEPIAKYNTGTQSDKDKIISLLENQVRDLKKDKELLYNIIKNQKQ